MRDAAKYKMSHDKEIDKIDEKIQALQGGTGFWSYFSYGPNEEQKKEIEELEKQKQKLIEQNVDQEVKERLKKISDTASTEVDTLRDVPDHFCLYKVNLYLPKVLFNINRQGEEKMISMEYDKFNIDAEMRKKGQFFSLLIDDIIVKQYQLKDDNVYETLMASIEQKNDTNVKDEKDKQGALYIEFENNPIFEKSNFRFKFRNTKRLVITLNLYSIQYILNKVLESLATTISKFGSERYVGTGEIQNLIKSGFEANYISGGYQHFNIDLDIVMKSPILLYPQDILDNYNRKCLFIRCGDFEMTSTLPPRQDLNKNYELCQNRAELFDIYTMKVENFCMATLDDFDGDFRSLATAKGLNLVDDISVMFIFEQMFEAKNKFFEKMKIFLKIGKCKFNLRDTQVIFFIELLEIMQKTNKILSFDLEAKTLLEAEEEKQNKEDAEKEENEKREKAKKMQEEEEKRIKAEKTKKLNKQKQEEEEKKKKQEDEMLKRLKDNEDPKYLIFEFILENVELCLMKSISLKERNIISDLNVDFDKEYRDFLVFTLNQFNIGVLMTEKGNMDVDITMESTNLKDKETIILSRENPKGDLLINKEFQDMIKMYTRERRPLKSSQGSNYSMTQSSMFNLKEAGIEIVKEEKRERNENKKFMTIEYRYNGITKMQEVNIVLQRIRICFSMSAMARLYQYYTHYYGMYCQSCDDVALVLANMDEKHKKEKLKEKIKYEKKLSANLMLERHLSDASSTLSSELSEDEKDISNIVEEEKEKKKIFGQNFSKLLCKDLKALGDNFQNNLIDTSADKEAEESIKKKQEELSKILTTTREKSNMKVKFEMKETMLEFPLDDTKSKTKVVRFKYNFVCSVLMDSEYDTTKDGSGKVVKLNYLSNNMKISAKFIKIGFNIVNFQNGIYTIENICDQMLEGFRFMTNINSFLLLPHREKSVMAIDVNFEPLTFNIGFRQTKTIMKFLPMLSQFLTDMYKEYDDPLKELNKNENDDMNDIIENENNNIINENNNIINENLNKINADEAEVNLVNLTEEELEKREIKKKQKIEKYKIKQKQLEQKKLREKKKKELQEEKAKEAKVICNTDNLNNMMDVKLTFQKFSFQFLDDSGAYLIPLLNIETKEILIKYITNSNPDSVENISNLILESIARKEIPLEEYDINGLSWYIELNFDTSINFYNDRINNWEPIIERYSGNLKVDQVTSFSRMKVLFKSDDYFNMNISITSMNVLNRVLKRFGETEEKWDKELNELTDVAKNKTDKVAVEFLNLTGMEIECWLDAEEIENNINNNKTYKYILDTDKKNMKKISRRRLVESYQKLSEAQTKIKKDKFSFRIRGYVPVYNNDFSSNYTTSFRMKRDQIAKNEIKTIYAQLKSTKTKKEGKNKENIKDIKNEPLIPNQKIEMRTNSEILTGMLDEDGELLVNNNNEINLNNGMKESNTNNDLIIADNNELNDEIEILVKVRQNGTMKSIVFQSNVFIFNNLQLPICLSFISNSDFVNKYNSKDENINHADNKNKIILNTCKRASIPINYIMKTYRVYVCFYDKLKKEENNYSLLYENFLNLKQNLPNFIKYNEENSLNYKGEKQTILKDNYSKIIEINQNNKNFYISSNLIIQRGTNDIIKDMPIPAGPNNKVNLSDENDLALRSKNIDILLDSLKHDFYCKTFSYLFILDESLLIENKIPFNVKCKLYGSNEKEMTIRPLQQKEFLDINQTKTNLQLFVNYQDKKFVSEILDIKELDTKDKDENLINTKEKGEDDESTIKQIKLYDGENKEKFLEFNIKFEDSFDSVNLVGAYEREYEYCIQTFQNKKKILFYSRCIIINKSDYLLYILGDKEKSKEKDMTKLDNYNYKILPHSINLMNTNDVKQPFKIKTENSEWSSKFNINTVGNTGVSSLNIVDKDNKNKVTILDIGISIPTSWYFTNSLLITIEPRFLFVNKLGFDIQYKQYDNKITKEKNDSNTLFENKTIKNNESITLNTIKATKNMKKMIQIKFGSSEEFSCPFDLEEMGDVDLKIPIDEETKNLIEEKNAEIDKEIKRLKKLEKKKKKEEQMKDQQKKEEIAKNVEQTNEELIQMDEFEEDEELIIPDKKDKPSIEEEPKKEKEKEKELTPEEDRQKRLEEKKKKLEEKKMKLRKYILFKQNYKNYLLVHITKSSYSGLIYIVLFPPEHPQYIISNESKQRLTFKQKKDEFSKEMFTLEKNESIPYIWGDSLKNEKLLIAMLDKNQVELNLNEIKIVKKKFEVKEKGVSNKYTFYFQTLIENNKTRKLIIKNEDLKNKNRGYFLQVLSGQRKSYNTKFKFLTKGLGLSIISNEPREIFYISSYGGIIDGNMFTFKKDDCEHSITNIGLVLKNFQIDYCLEDNFKSFIIPVNQITQQLDEEATKKNEVLTPLFQSIISYHTITNPLTQVSSDEFPQIDITIQPVKLNVTQNQLMSLLNLYNEIMPELDFWLVKPEPHEEYNTIEDLIQHVFGEEANKKDELIYDPEFYDPALDLALSSFPEEIIYESENHWMFFIKNIAIGSLDIVVSTRIDLKGFGEFLPGFLMGIISAIGNVFTHITDYHLKFTSLLYTDVFTDIWSLSGQLTNNYISQVKRRIFNIIGSLDILGNPTGYASAIGDGFMQIIEAPRKGLINGPLGFGSGIAIGFGTFITTIISSSFDVVGKITGTLLASCESIQGTKAVEQLEEREPEHVLDGLFKGLKEGVIDLSKGIGGLLFKPYEGAKKQGVKGFFTGLGSGLVGAVISPFTAGFRVANNLFIGLKNTANVFNPKLKSERFRYPRTIQKSEGLKSYDENRATIRAILDFLKDYSSHEIIHYNTFNYISPGLQNSISTLILTNKCILVVYEAKEVVFKLDLSHISKVEVHKDRNQANFNLIFYLKDNSRKYITTKNNKVCEEFYLMFNKSKE